MQTPLMRFGVLGPFLLAAAAGLGSSPRLEALPREQRKEPPESARLRQACLAGNGDACNSLGVDYEYGDGVTRDLAESVALYHKACDAGHAGGCDNLGEMYAEGKGVAADPARAVAAFRKSCDGGLPLGCEHLREAPGGDPKAQPPPPLYDGLYRGEIGGKRVLALVEGTDGDPDVWGRCAYLAVGLPISLRGTLKGDAADLAEVEPAELPDGEDGVSGRWSGRFSSRGFRGEWTSPDGSRRHPIALALVTRGTGRGTALDEAFHDELARLNLVPDAREVVAGDVAYRLVRQVKAGVAFPRLSRHPDPAVLDRVNADLEKRLIASASNALSCAPSVCRGCESHEDLDVGLFTPRILSLRVGGGAYCGGPHVVDWADAVNYDLKTGATLDLAEEFVLTTSDGKLREDGLSLLLKHSDGMWDDQEQRAECYGDESEASYRVLLSLTDTGLRVATNFGRHIEVVCAVDAVIPYAELSAFRRKDSPYRFGPER